MISDAAWMLTILGGSFIIASAIDERIPKYLLALAGIVQ